MKIVDSLNGICNMFIYIQIDAQHPLNKPLTKRETDNRSWLYAQLLFWSVEILLRVYIAYYQYDYILIQQFNKKTMDLQRFKLLPCDGIKASHPPYRLIPTLPIVVQLVGDVCQSVRCWRELPTLLQYLPYLVLLRLDIRVCQQREHVVTAKRKSVDTRACHDIKYKFTYLYLQSVAVAADNLLQGFGMQQ